MLPPRIGLVLAGLLVFSGAGAADEAEVPGPFLGAALPGSVIPAELSAKDPAHALPVRLDADWAAIETSDGVYDWSQVAAPLSVLAPRGTKVTLRVRGESPLHPRDQAPGAVPDAAWLDAWSALLRSAVATLGGQVAVIEVGEHPEKSFEAAAYAFVLKSSSLAVKAEAKARGIDLEVAQGVVGAEALAWQTELWSNDAAPYADILPVEFSAGADVGAGIAAFSAEAVQHPPAADLRADVLGDDADRWASFRGAVAALASSAKTALVTLPGDPEGAAAVARSVSELQSRLAAGYQPAPYRGLTLKNPEGGAAEGASVIGRFLHAKDFTTIVVYQAPLAPAATDGQSRLLLDTVNVKEPAVWDLLSGSTYKTGPAVVPGEKAKALRVLVADHPMAIVWERAVESQAGLDVDAEDVDVKTTRGLTAQEIVARNRQVEKVQDDRLLRWTAKGRADLHFKVAQAGGSITVGIESNYFWRRGAPLEWQQTRYYVNGNRITWKKIPELPLFQPEKVVTLPLDLTFDKTYDYELSGEDTLDGRAAYVVAFTPSASFAGKSLYRGRVWIDRESFVRLRTSVIQTNLEPPVLQNEETDTYVPVTGPDGATYIVIGRIDGQQLWSGGGRNFVVRREVAFSDFEINLTEEALEAALKAAYASDDQVLRDTEHGFRYLEKQPDGERVVNEHPKTSALAAGAGVMKDDASSGVIPLAGVNWFDYDFLKKKIQVNVFFAGVFVFANLTDPSVHGTKLDLGVEVSLLGLKLDDKFFSNGIEDMSQRIRRRSQYVTGRLGRPLGNFFKISAIGDWSTNAYFESSDARAPLAAQNVSFVLPPNHQVYSGTLQAEFNRKGYSITTAGTYSRRSKWDRWGLFSNATSTFLDPTVDPDRQSFTTWKLTAFKEWYLPKFQKLKAEVDYLDGRNLDRFSQYRFGRFGDESLEGFAGTGVRFDTGYIGRAGWSFNVFNAVTFGLSVELAHVNDRRQDDRFRNHTGAGLSFNVVGPWKTFWRGSYGRAIASDVPVLEGKQEFQLVILKLF